MPVVLLAGLFVSLCVFCICWLLLQGYAATLGALLGKLADESKAVSFLGFYPLRWLGHDLDKINHFLMLQLGNAVEGSAHAWHTIVGQVTSFVHETMDAIADLAEATERGFRHVSTTVIHETVHVPVMGLTKTLGRLSARVTALAATVAALPHAITNTVTHEVTKVVTKVPTITKVITHTIVHAPAAAIAVAQPKIGGLTREVDALQRWVRSHGKSLTEAGAVGLVLAALSRIGIHWTRCSNTTKAGKQICGMDPSLLESLLADTILIVGTVDLVEFARELGTVVQFADKEARRFWKVK